jgi:hypothetical protein
VVAVRAARDAAPRVVALRAVTVCFGVALRAVTVRFVVSPVDNFFVLFGREFWFECRVADMAVVPVSRIANNDISPVSLRMCYIVILLVCRAK